MDSILLPTLPHKVGKKLQWCDPVRKRTISCPIQISVRALHGSLTFKDFRPIFLSFTEVPALCRAVDCSLAFRNANLATTLFYRSSRHLSCWIFRPAEDILNHVNGFSSLAIDSHPTPSGSSHLRQLGGQSGDNTCVDGELLSTNGVSSAVAATHDPSQELTLLYLVPDTDSSDAYHTAYNYHTLSFESVVSLVDQSTVSYFSQPMGALPLQHSSSRRENSYRIDQSGTSDTMQDKQSTDLFHCVLEDGCLVTPSISSFYQFPSLDDPDRYSIDLTDQNKEITKLNQGMVCSSIIPQCGIVLYNVTEEWPLCLPYDMAQLVQVALPDSMMDLWICSKLTFMVYDLRLSLQELSSREPQIITISDSVKSLLCYASDMANHNQPENESLLTDDDKMKFIVFKNVSYCSNIQGLAALFLQNSASDKDSDPTVKELSNKSPNSSTKSNTCLLVPPTTTVYVGQCTERHPSHLSLSSVHGVPQQLHLKYSNNLLSAEENKELSIETRLSRFSSVSHISHQLSNLPVELGSKPSVVSVCGVEMDIDEIKSLRDVPPEFTTAEVLCRRSVKSDLVHGERISRMSNKRPSTNTFKRLNSSEETNKRSSILAVRKPDELAAEPRNFNAKTTCETELGQAVPTPNRTGRSSLIMLHPPQTHLTRVIDEAALGNEAQDSNLKFTRISWTSIDSTELSRGLNLINLVKDSSSELFDTLISSKDSKIPDLVSKKCSLDTGELQINLLPTKGLTFSNARRSSLEQRSMFAKGCSITPALHSCGIGHVNKEGSHRRTASPDSSRFIGLMKKFAAARLQTKNERFPYNGIGKTSNLTMFCSSIPRR